jgi:DNA-binding beta-propeller fold protein YncE
VCLSGGGGVTFLNGESLTPLGKVDLHSAVDELQYDAKEHRLYAGVMDAAKPGIAVIDAAKRQLVDSTSLSAKPQGFVLEESGPHLYANTPGAQQVTVVDRKKRAVVGQWKLGDAKSNYPIALDEANHRLFVGCRRPPCLLVLDTASGNSVAKIETGGDADDMSFDATGKRIYLACGDGVISAIIQTDANRYRKLPDVVTVEDARNSLFVPELKAFFLAVPPHQGAAAELREYHLSSDL